MGIAIAFANAWNRRKSFIQFEWMETIGTERGFDTKIYILSQFPKFLIILVSQSAVFQIELAAIQLNHNGVYLNVLITFVVFICVYCCEIGFRREWWCLATKNRRWPLCRLTNGKHQFSFEHRKLKTQLLFMTVSSLNSQF